MNSRSCACARPKRRHVGKRHLQRDELHAGADVELVGLATPHCGSRSRYWRALGIFGAGGLGLQQEGREVGGIEGMAHRAQHLGRRPMSRSLAVHRAPAPGRRHNRP